MSYIRADLVSFMAAHPLGGRVHQGSLKVPAGDRLEGELPEYLDAFARSTRGAPRDEDNIPARFHDAPVAGVVEKILERASKLADPHDPEKYPDGFALLPSGFAKSDVPGIVAVELSPMHLSDLERSLVGAPVAKLFLDTTPGQDGVDYLLTY